MAIPTPNWKFGAELAWYKCQVQVQRSSLQSGLDGKTEPKPGCTKEICVAIVEFYCLNDPATFLIFLIKSIIYALFNSDSDYYIKINKFKLILCPYYIL